MGLGLYSLNHLIWLWLWGRGAIPSCLVPGPGVIRVDEQWPGL